MFFREKQVLGELLRESRTAFDFVGGEVLPGGADDADRIDADVIVKANIFDGEDRVLQHRRNLFVLERNSFLERKLADHRFAVVGINARDDAGTIGRKRRDFIRGARVVELVSGDDAGQPAGGERQQQDGRQPEPAQQVSTLFRRCIDDCGWTMYFERILQP